MHGLKTLPNVLRLFVGLVVLSAVMGLLVAGLAIPAVGAVGSATTSGVKAFNELPSEFDISPLAQQSKILDADGGLIANPYDENRIIVPLNRISPWMQKAQIAIEDSRFYEHGGLDVRGFTRAFVSNLGGGETQGASTLTQQYVKITLQENALRRDDQDAAKAAVEKTYTRKIQELKYALDVERNYTKDQILAGYLNLVYYGDQAYGVEAAAQNYFGVPASKLSLAQAATLAGIVQQPTAYNPVTNAKASETRRNVVLDRMQELGTATPTQVAEAKKTSVKASLKKKPAKGVCQRSREPYFCAYILQWLQASPQMAVLGKTPAERLKNINQGGLTIRTTLQPGLQKSTLRELTKAVPIANKSNLGAASTVIEPGTGKVLAMAQASDFTKQQVNWNADQKYGGGPYGYQFGSTAKVYALVTALERGMPMDGTIKAPTASPTTPHYFMPSSMHDACKSYKPWPVENDYAVGGTIPLQKAISQSINTAFAALVIKLGGCTVRDTMTRMGLHASNGAPVDKNISSITLGAATTTPMTIASSYATLAARGKYCEPFPVASITSSDKKQVKIPASSCKQVLDPGVADGVNRLLEGPLKNGTAAGRWNYAKGDAAGKTGTTDAHNQSWFVGYTPQRASAVWIGNVKVTRDGTNKPRTLNGKCFGEYGCPGQVFGGTVAAPVWQKIMTAAMQGLPVKRFTAPSAKVNNGNYVAVPSVTGTTVEAARNILEGAGFSTYVAGRVNSRVAAGRVAGTDPSGRAMKDSSVGILVSTGYVPAVKKAVKPKVGSAPRRTTATPARTTSAPKPTPAPKPTTKPKPSKKPKPSTTP
jgi:membrane peptidoglycan carboxypeptidase